MSTLPALLFVVLSWNSVQAQEQPPPIIDMHLHAMAANAQGPPPVPICSPFNGYLAWDLMQPYREVLRAMVTACGDPVRSPETDEEVMNQTIAAMERWNMVGVLSESPDRVATWRAAAPDRFIPGLSFDGDGIRPPPRR